MELNITEFFNAANAFDYSASCAELGENAGGITWNNAKNADFNLLDSEEKREHFKEYIRGFGAWSDDEISAWTNSELNALCIQLVSGDIREFEELAESDWNMWQELSERGTVSGNLYGGPLSIDGQIYYCMES